MPVIAPDWGPTHLQEESENPEPVPKKKYKAITPRINSTSFSLAPGFPGILSSVPGVISCTVTEIRIQMRPEETVKPEVSPLLLLVPLSIEPPN